MAKAKTLLALVAGIGAISVALDWPPGGPVVGPPIHVVLDRCAQPRTLGEAYDVLARMLDPGLIRQIKAGSEQDVMVLNNTIGMALRNLWGLWNGSRLSDHFRALGIRHPDDMTALLLITFWRHLNDQPLRVDEEVARLEATNAAGIWKPDPQCRCEASGRCTSTVVTDRRMGSDRGFQVSGCCCLQTPQVMEGRPFALPPPGRAMVVPPAFSFREIACGATFQ
jgi:hypothetical protein